MRQRAHRPRRAVCTHLHTHREPRAHALTVSPHPIPSPGQVNLRLFTPAPNKRRTVLLFVFRDRTRTPLEKLTEVWEADLQRMWAAIAKPPELEEYGFADFFEVRYAALSNFEEREEDFRAEAVMLRRRFSSDGARAALSFCLLAQRACWPARRVLCVHFVLKGGGRVGRDGYKLVVHAGIWREWGHVACTLATRPPPTADARKRAHACGRGG